MNELEYIDAYLQVLRQQLGPDEMAKLLAENRIDTRNTVYQEAKDLYHAIRYYNLKEIYEFFQHCDEKILDQFVVEEVVKDSITHVQRKELFEHLQSLEKKQVLPRIVPFWTIQKIAIAATVLVILGIMWILFTPQSPQSAYQEFFSMPAHNYLTRSSDSINETIVSAFQKYDAGQYQEAIVMLDSAIQSLQDPNLLFYKGVAQLETNQLRLAVVNLEDYLKADPVSSRGRWYLALAYLKNNELAKTKVLLADLKTTPNDYQVRATKLYRRIF